MSKVFDVKLKKNYNKTKHLSHEFIANTWDARFLFAISLFHQVSSRERCVCSVSIGKCKKISQQAAYEKNIIQLECSLLKIL